MQLQILEPVFTLCKVKDASEIDLSADFTFLGKTDQELSLACQIERVPAHTLERDDGWRAFRVTGKLDFSLIGILARIASLLAENRISMFAVSTYDTDYVLIKEAHCGRAMEILGQNGYSITR